MGAVVVMAMMRIALLAIVTMIVLDGQADGTGDGQDEGEAGSNGDANDGNVTLCSPACHCFVPARQHCVEAEAMVLSVNQDGARLYRDRISCERVCGCVVVAVGFRVCTCVIGWLYVLHACECTFV